MSKQETIDTNVTTAMELQTLKLKVNLLSRQVDRVCNELHVLTALFFTSILCMFALYLWTK